MTIKRFDPDALDQLNAQIRDQRRVMRYHRKNDRDAEEAEALRVLERLKAKRAGMKEARRRERREEGRALDQILAKAAEAIVDQEKAGAFAEAEVADQVGAILTGRRTVEEAVDIALANMAKEADHVFDFSVIPFVGPFLEMYDDRLFAWALPAIRKLVQQAFDKALAKKGAKAAAKK